MPLYTFFLEYRGGTYISQVRAQSSNSALRVWARTLNKTELSQLDTHTKSSLVEKVQSDIPIAIEGVKNTWCCTALLDQHMAIINFTQTVD
jgi:hypothetical protein